MGRIDLREIKRLRLAKHDELANKLNSQFPKSFRLVNGRKVVRGILFKMIIRYFPQIILVIFTDVLFFFDNECCQLPDSTPLS